MAACPTINLTGGIPEGRRFLITDEEKAYYKIICGLAYSQWSWYVSPFSNFCIMSFFMHF
jgi:hypothetical protein